MADRVGREMDAVAVDVEDTGGDRQRDRPPTAAEYREGQAAAAATANGVARSIQSPAVSPASAGTW